MRFCATKNREQSKVQPARNFRFAARSMPDAGNGDNLFSRQHSINDAVWVKNNFPNRFVIFLRHNATELRELCEHVHLGHKPATKGFRDSRIILRDKQNDGLQIVARLLRPDYFVSHVANCRLTSSCGMVSPRSIWSSPLRMAARNSTRSAMTSRLAFSGKRSIESKANCLSLMSKKITPVVSRRKREAEAGEKTGEILIQTVFDELPVP